MADSPVLCVQALHTTSPPVAHFDLKPLNVLLLGDSTKICDFGIATPLPGGETLSGVRWGTPRYQVHRATFWIPSLPFSAPIAPAQILLAL